MWIFTKYGFFSVVCARRGFGHPFEPIDPNRVMVRSRSRSHLEALQKRFSQAAGEIMSFDGSDYPYRVFLPKSVWATIMAELSMEIDYDNFKSEVAESGLTEPAYGQCLHLVWSTMRSLEK